jgi:thioredoxin reductase (NADPH)
LALGRRVLPLRFRQHPRAYRVLVLDCRAFGGQAGASARIENYLSFPTGITGMALMARAYNQAQKFRVEM